MTSVIMNQAAKVLKVFLTETKCKESRRTDPNKAYNLRLYRILFEKDVSSTPHHNTFLTSGGRLQLKRNRRYHNI